MAKLLLHIACLLIAMQIAAQEKLEADRPGETRNPELVKGNHFHVEAGLRKEKLSDDQRLYQHPSATLRYGLFNAIELRMEMISQTLRNRETKHQSNGLLPLEFGVKAKILPEYKGFPSVAVLALVGIPSTASNDYFNRRIPFEFRTLFGNKLHEKLKIQYNAGVKWQGDDRRAEWMYSFTPVFEASDKINLFIEQYAFMKKAEVPQHYFDGGIEYYLRKNVMADFSAGVGLSQSSSPYFLAAGLSFRIPVR